MILNWDERGLNNLKALLMLGCCWKEGHTVYLPKDYEFKHSIPDFFSDFVQIKSSESRSSCWHLLNACPAWNTSSDFLGDTRWHHVLLWPCFAKSLFCYCLFFAKQAVEKNHIKCLTRHLTWVIFPHSPDCPPHKIMGLWAELHGHFQPAGHLSLFRGFPGFDSRILEVSGNLNGSVIVEL